MYYNQSIEEYNISIFKLFIQRTLEGFSGYRDEIIFIVSEAKKLHERETNIYSIDKESFELILFLRDNANEFLDSINTDQIRNNDYKRLLDILEKEDKNLSHSCMYNY